MTLGDLIDEVIGSVAADGLSPFPGFFTLATIAKAVFFRGWEGKGRSDRFGQRSPSKAQLLAIKRYLDDYYETKQSGRHTYYSRNKRR